MPATRAGENRKPTLACDQLSKDHTFAVPLRDLRGLLFKRIFEIEQKDAKGAKEFRQIECADSAA